MVNSSMMIKTNEDTGHGVCSWKMRMLSMW